MAPLRFDLQSHSTHSDGALPAAAVVERAAAAGVELLALSDHDTVGGVSEALLAGERTGVRVVPATEISAVDDFATGETTTDGSATGGEGPTTDGSAADGGAGSRDGRELHILGYLLDHTDPAFQATLAEFLADREQRTLRMAAGLREAGFDLDERQLSTRVAAGQPIGRPHLAEAVLGAPANAERLRDEDIDDIGSLIRGYLVEGRPAFRLRETPTVAQAVAAIHAAGGVAVWAHPFWDIPDPAEVVATVERFRALGIDGVEAFYITHTQEQTELLAARCAALDLLSTGSADFHGPDNRLFSRFLAFETYGLEPNLGPIASGG
jgi:predicted metal-dependent phosphoesterase TrpH